MMIQAGKTSLCEVVYLAAEIHLTSEKSITARNGTQDVTYVGDTGVSLHDNNEEAFHFVEAIGIEGETNVFLYACRRPWRHG
jgi:hypothetical protein